jgi:hypothetical protein
MEFFYLDRTLPIEIGYDLGYLVGVILSRSRFLITHCYTRNGGFLVYSYRIGLYFLTALSALQTHEHFIEKDDCFILTGQLYQRMKKLIHIVEHEWLNNKPLKLRNRFDIKSFKDDRIGLNKAFVEGILHVYTGKYIYTLLKEYDLDRFQFSNRELAEHVQKWFWYWFEYRVNIVSQSKHSFSFETIQDKQLPISFKIFL